MTAQVSLQTLTVVLEETLLGADAPLDAAFAFCRGG